MTQGCDLDEALFVLHVRVTPGASRAAVGGTWEGPDGVARLVVRVPVPPEKGRATQAAGALLAQAFGVPKSAVVLRAGAANRLKSFEVTGDRAVLAARLAVLLGG